MTLDDFIAERWDELQRGGRVTLPPEVESPRDRPDLFAEVVGFPVGQGCDFAMRVGDGRVHAQCLSGEVVLHYDAIDPSRSRQAALRHFVVEAPWLKATIAVAAAYWLITLRRSPGR